MNSNPLSVNSGGEYAITEDLGVTAGNNLFHSFHTFNISQGETATFSGAPHIDNVISRVTGGSPSSIDGTLKNTIPGADTWLMNPAGLLFGEHAQLDVQGSFHATTADSLKFADGTEFHADMHQTSRFSAQPPHSFGFLPQAHGAIEVNGRGGTEATPRPLLQVPAGRAIALIGGEIRLSQGGDDLPRAQLPDDPTPEAIRTVINRNQRYSQLHAPAGRIYLAAVQGDGAVALHPERIESSAEAGAAVHLEQAAFISTSGEGGGNVLIRAGEFVLDHSRIGAQTTGRDDGGVVEITAARIRLRDAEIAGGTVHEGKGTDIRLSAQNTLESVNTRLNTDSGSKPLPASGEAGAIHLQGGDLTLRDEQWSGRIISSDSYGPGRGGDITLTAAHRLWLDDVFIQTSTYSSEENAGAAGNIEVQGAQVDLESSEILTWSNGSGDGGRLAVRAGRLYMGKLDAHHEISWLQSSAFGKGDSGDIIVAADSVLIEHGAQISAESYGAGAGGDVHIHAQGDVTLREVDALGYTSGIMSGTQAFRSHTQAGDGKSIVIRADNLYVLDGGRIDAGTVAQSDTGSSGDAGDIRLEISGRLVVAGVNPYGENLEGFGSRIAANSVGKTAGAAGDIHIDAGEVLIRDGGVIQSSSDNSGPGGVITLQARQRITIHGDASQIPLREPARAQQSFLASEKPETANQSISGIYAHSTSQALDSGDSGSIGISTPALHLFDGGRISTASQGGGQAGQIRIRAGQVEMRDNAAIQSGSHLINQLRFDAAQARDQRILAIGKVVKTEDIGDNKATYHVNAGNKTLLGIIPITEVPDQATLKRLPEQIEMRNTAGAVVTVADAGDGQSARFFFHYMRHDANKWTRIATDQHVTLTRLDSTLEKTTQPVPVALLPYANGTPIHVDDMGNGKGGDFVYLVHPVPDSDLFYGLSERVKTYHVADMQALTALSASTDLSMETVVQVDGEAAKFVFNGERWIRLGDEIRVPDVAARRQLVLAEPGYIARLPEGDSIYTGNAWIPLGATHRVADLAARDALDVAHGDLVKVADTGNGRHDAFLYADGEWITQIRGGDAGGIELNVGELRMSRDSEITTASVSGGGGGIRVAGDGLVVLQDSRMTTSVQEGAGRGGDLHMDAKFLVQARAPVTARAVEGDGGNIAIATKGIYRFPPAAESPIDASSQFGVSGQVALNSAEINPAGSLFIVGGQFLQAGELALQSCEVSAGGLSRFGIRDKPAGRPGTAADFMY